MMGGQHLIGAGKIYTEGTRLVEQANEHIRAAMLSSSSKPPTEFFDAVAGRLKKAKQTGTPIQFDRVVAMNFLEIEESFASQVDSRNEVFKKHRVHDCIELRLLDLRPPLGFDLLIIDKKHMILGFPTSASLNFMQNAILFENQPQMIEKFVDWFDRVIMRQAIKYEDWSRIDKDQGHK